MKYVVSSSLFYSRLQMLGRVIPSKAVLPVFGSFSFDIQGKTMQVTASDGETTIKTRIELLEANQDFKFMLEAGRMIDILKQISEQPLTIEIDPSNYQVEVRYQNGHLSFQGESNDDYPVAHREEGEAQVVTIAGGRSFSKGIASALFAAADKDSGRRVMEGVYMDIMPGSIALVASDGHKLVRYGIKTDSQDVTVGFTFPQKPASLLKTIAEGAGGDVKLNIYGRKAAVIELGDYEIECRLIDDPYPNYKSVIPQKNENVAVINRGALTNGLRRMMALLSRVESSGLVRCHLENNSIKLTVGEAEFSVYGEETLVCHYDGTPITIGFNAGDLLGLLGQVDTEDVVIKLADAVKAGLILPANTDGDEPEGDLLILLMPILINN